MDMHLFYNQTERASPRIGTFVKAFFVNGNFDSDAYAVLKYLISQIVSMHDDDIPPTEAVNVVRYNPPILHRSSK